MSLVVGLRRNSLLAAAVCAVCGLGLFLPSPLLLSLSVIGALYLLVRATAVRWPSRRWGRRFPSRFSGEGSGSGSHRVELRVLDASVEMLNHLGGHASRQQLAHLMYLADRQSLARYGRSITHDDLCATADGLSGSRLRSMLYSSSFRSMPEGRGRLAVDVAADTVSLLEYQTPLSLSRNDQEVLAAVAKEHAAWSVTRLRQNALSLPEWRDPSPREMCSVSEAHILVSTGWSEAEAQEAIQNNAYLSRFTAA